MRTDPRVMRAIVALEGAAPADFGVVLDWLRGLRADARASEEIKEETLLRWHQGQAQALNHVVTIAETARETLRKIT